MRQLHVVALSEDGRSVLLATSKSAKTGGFSLPLDATLAAALRGDLPRPGEQQVRETGVSPKEIQARLRSGESPQQIADSAGVPVARVDRFAGPVLSERERIIDEARAAFLNRNRRGLSQLPLGDAVDSALAETASLRPDSVTWTARRLESGHWLVQVSYVARARTKTASWVYEPHTRAVFPSDAASAALGHVGEESAPRRLPAAAVRRAPVAGAPVASKPARKATKKKAGAKKAAGRKKAASAPVATRVTPKPAAAPVVKKVAVRVAVKAAQKTVKRGAKTVKTAATKPTAPAKKVAAPQPVARQVAPAKKVAAPQPVARQAAPAKKVVAPKPVARREAPAKRVATKPVATKAAAAKRPARPAASRTLRRSAAAEELGSTPVVQWGPPVGQPGPPTLRVVPHPEPDPEPLFEPAPPPPVEIAEEPVAAVPAPKRRAAGERAHVPDWADVLLGATPKRTDD